MKHKECSRCGEYKEASNFYKDKRCKDGMYSSCKACHYKYRSDVSQYCIAKLVKSHPTIENVSSYMFARISYRVSNDVKYANVKCLMSKEEFKEYIRTNWKLYMCLHDDWRVNNWARRLSPTIDRLNSKSHYMLSNIELVPLHINVKRAKVGSTWTDEQKLRQSSLMKEVYKRKK